MDPPLITVGMAGDIMTSGMVATPPYTVGTVVTYTCQPGWRLDGMGMSMCQGAPSFAWSLMGSDIPRCLRGNVRLICIFKFIQLIDKKNRIFDEIFFRSIE